MQYKYFLFLFLCVSTYPVLSQSPEQRASSLFFTPRSRSSSRSLSMAASLVRVRAPILSRIVSKVGWPAVFAVAGAVKKAFAQRQAALPIIIKPDEMNEYRDLQKDLRDIFKKPQTPHLIERGYPELAPTTESQVFENAYSPEKLYQIVKTQGREKLVGQLKKDYLYLLDSETKRRNELQEQQQQIVAEQSAEQRQQQILALEQQQPTWWQRMTGFAQKSPEQQQSAARLEALNTRFAYNQELLNSSSRIIQEKTQQLQAIKARIEALD